jgi:hypothetical protein
MAEDNKLADEARKEEWAKPRVSLVEAGKAESAPVNGPDGYYNFS